MAIMPPIPKPDEMFKAALLKSRKRAGQISGRSKQGTIKARELARVEVLGSALESRLSSIVQETAGFERLPMFQREMCKSLVDVDKVRKALHSIGWAGKKIGEMGISYRKKMRVCRDLKKMTAMRKAYEARVESIMKQVKKDFEVLHQARAELKKMPSVREMDTVVVAGYPNVGKSSILNGMSDSKVKVMHYPFTTQQILVGYARKKFREVQIIDTPGILDRPVEKMNRIEKQALMAVKHLGKHVVFVIDPTGACGFEVGKQLALMEAIRKEFRPKMVVVVNKKDIATPEQLKGLKYDFLVSTKSGEDMEMLKNAVFSLFRQRL